MRLFETPVPTVGFRDPACAVHAIARAARSNTYFRAKVAEGMVGEQQNSDQRSVLSKHRYLETGSKIAHMQRTQLRAKHAKMPGFAISRFPLHF